MSHVPSILLASHGTAGAQAAERKVFEIYARDTRVTHLLVVPEFWQYMLGDDWLSSSSTRKQFGDYLEAELDNEVNQHIERIHSQFMRLGVQATHKVVSGSPEKCLINACRESIFDLVVMGSPRPRGMPGLSSRMATKAVSSRLTAPLLQVPYPDV